MADKFYKPFYGFMEFEGSPILNKNFSSGEVLKIQPAAGEILIIHRLIAEVQDTRVGFDVDSFGGMAALTNGIGIKVENASGVLVDLTNGLPIKTNSDWGRFCYDVNRIDYGNGDYSLQARWTFSKAGVPLRLDGDAGEFLAMYFEDDFTDISHMSFNYQGYYLDKPLEANRYDD